LPAHHPAPNALPPRRRHRAGPPLLGRNPQAGGSASRARGASRNGKPHPPPRAPVGLCPRSLSTSSHVETFREMNVTAARGIENGFTNLFAFSITDFQAIAAGIIEKDGVVKSVF